MSTNLTRMSELELLVQRECLLDVSVEQSVLRKLDTIQKRLDTEKVLQAKYGYRFKSMVR